MSLRRRRHGGDKPKAQIDMNSLIDLTFLLLVTFIVTLPALEQTIPIMLPEGKAAETPTKDGKANVISVDSQGRIFLNDKPITLDDLEVKLGEMAKADPDVPVLVRGDERLDYGSVMNVVKVIYKCKIHKMGLQLSEK